MFVRAPNFSAPGKAVPCERYNLWKNASCRDQRQRRKENPVEWLFEAAALEALTALEGVLRGPE